MKFHMQFGMPNVSGWLRQTEMGLADRAYGSVGVCCEAVPTRTWIIHEYEAANATTGSITEEKGAENCRTCIPICM